jgi:orotate phosphoribosyltransferase
MNYLDLFKKTGALLEGRFILTSGLHSPHYFQCAKVLQYPETLEELSKNVADAFRNEEIDLVISPAVGGIVFGTEVGRQLKKKTIFAERQNGEMTLRRGFEINKGEKVLVVEDVVTTGGSVEEVISVVRENGGEVVGVGFIVDRSNGTKKFDVPKQHSLVKMEVKTFKPDEWPKEELGDIPAVKPGSRGLK